MCGDTLNVLQIVPVILGQPFAANESVEAFNIGVLLRFAGPDIFKLDVPCRGPLDNGCTQILWAVIAANG